MSALRTFFCILHKISHFSSKPSNEFHEVIVGFSEEDAVVLTVKFCGITETVNPLHDVLKPLIDVEQIDELWG